MTASSKLATLHQFFSRLLAPPIVEHTPLTLSAYDEEVQLAERLYDGHNSLSEAPKENAKL